VGSSVAVAGVVDQHVDRAEPGFGRAHRLSGLAVVGHVQGQRERVVRLGEVLDLGYVTGRDGHVVAAVQDRFGE
jgi:hypothetical protein